MQNIKNKLMKKYILETIGLLIVILIMFDIRIETTVIEKHSPETQLEEEKFRSKLLPYMTPTSQLPDSKLILNHTEADTFALYAGINQDLYQYNTLEENTKEESSNDEESEIIEEPTEVSGEAIEDIKEELPVDEKLEVKLIEEETIVNSEEIISEEVPVSYEYDNVWVSSDGEYAYRYHTGTWEDAMRGNANGITIKPEYLDILYNTWTNYPNLIEFDYLLGLIMKESNGRQNLEIIDTNGQRSSGMLQFNNYAGKFDGNAMAIIRTGDIPRIIVGQEAIASKEEGSCVWFVDSWDATNVKMMAERWCIYNSILREIGWSHQKYIMAHRYGSYTDALNNTSLQETEIAVVEEKINKYIAPYRLN